MIVDPSIGMIFGCGVSAHPKLTKPVPDATPPCDGVSIDPNGRVAVAFAQVIVRDPNHTVWPSRSVTQTWNTNVPFP